MTEVRLQPLTRAKVASLGDAGRAWQAGLPDALARLEERWGVRVGRPLPGGSASYVARAEVVATGEPRVVKVMLPERGRSGEAATLVAAGGRGYAVLHDWSADDAALLLEALGPSAEQSPAPVGPRLSELAETLTVAWTVETAAPVPTPGEDKAAELHRLVRDHAARLGADVAPAGVVERALTLAERLAASYRPAECVVVHGDPHPGNALRVTAPRAGAPAGWVYVDPDGFRGDPAYDLGVLVREWCAQVEVADDPHGLVEGWCAMLADRTGLDAGRIWNWGLLERVSTGLYVTGFGGHALGRRFLASAARLL